MSFLTFVGALAFIQGQRYPLVFIAMIIEGPIITSASAFAASLGLFDVYVIFALSILGNLVADLVFFSIGYFGKKKFIKRYGKHLGLSKSRIATIYSYLKKHAVKTLIAIKLSPVVPGLGIVLIAHNMSFKKFFLVSLGINIPIALFFTLVGFYFGLAFNKFTEYFNLVTALIVFIVCLSVLIPLISKGVSKITTRGLVKLKK